MSGGQFVHVIPLPIGRLIAVKTRSVPRGDSPLYESDGISWETVDVRASTGTALNERPN
jgi:hypothetical protein